MADQRYSYWIEEASPTYRGPTISRALFLFALLALLLVALLGGAQTTTDGGGTTERVRYTDTTVPPCAQHFPPTCKRR